MTSDEREHWQRIEEVLFEALEVSPEERRTLLDRRCGDDPAFRQEIEDLLARSDSGDGPLEALQQTCLEELADALSDGDGASAAAQERTLIGPYRLLGEIGRGGMGVVHLAERADGQYTQRVAVKLLRHGFEDEETRDRFLRERQILARLEHPHIARLYDGGVTDDGIPFFVMEFVEGSSFNEHCDRLRLTIAERLSLFEQVCLAIQHAHRNLVIHCDLKPGNVLVTSTGEVKLLDFGIAKLAREEQGDALTRPGVRPLTHRYASPEQLRGEELTTSTDVYGLGLLLGEVLCGRRIRTGPADRPEIASPSAALVRDGMAAAEEAAAARRTTTPRLRSELRGDLDNIVLLALREEPGSRYGTVEAFIDDLRNYRDGRPVRATAPTLQYRTRHFLRRHRVGVTVGSAIFLGLILAVAGTTAGLVRAKREQREAERQALTANQVTDFLVDLMRAPDPARNAGVTPTVREILDRAVEQLPDKLATQPAVRGKILGSMGMAYLNLGLQPRAKALSEEGLDLLERTLGPDHPDVANSLYLVGMVRNQMSDYPGADSVLERALKIEEKVHGPFSTQASRAHRLLGLVVRREGDLPRATRHLEAALAGLEKTEGSAGSMTGLTLIQLGDVYLERGESDQAIACLERSLSILENVHGVDNEQVAHSLMNLGGAYLDAGRTEDAYRTFTRGLDMRRKVFGPRHPKVAMSMSAQARALVALGRAEEALPVAREALDIQREFLAPGHDWAAFAAMILAQAQGETGDPAGAEENYRHALQSYRKRFGEASPDYLECLLAFAQSSARQSRFDVARGAFEDVLRIEDRMTNRNPAFRARATAAYEDLLRQMGQAGDVPVEAEGPSAAPPASR